MNPGNTPDNREPPKPGERYQRHDGDIFLVVGTAYLKGDGTPLVVYRPQISVLPPDWEAIYATHAETQEPLQVLKSDAGLIYHPAPWRSQASIWATPVEVFMGVVTEDSEQKYRFNKRCLLK